MIKQFVFHGQITTRRRLFLIALASIALGIAWMLLFMILPSFFVGLLSLTTRGPDGQIVWHKTLDNLRR
ncbi:MAG: hypothetical protein ACO36I_26605 [Candidatus Latescibacterota bacterium]